MWTATPCKTTNCSPCGFCAYCCGRYGIGCQYCYAAAEGVTRVPAAAGRCDDEQQSVQPVAADPLESALADVLTELETGR